MGPKKTRQEREAELRALITTPSGRGALEALATSYQADGGRLRPPYTSVIGYIIVHERARGMIEG